jgi:HTH-type transcriptional regulator, sugar sensing transcriptional regulator
MNLIESLKNLGLNEKEAKIYLALLQLGKTTAYNVAVRSGLKKPTTYVILDQLVEKGYAFKVPRVKKQLYVAESPDVVFALAKERLLFTKDALPELMAMKKGEKGKVNVAYFEGARGAAEIYRNMFKVLQEKPQSEKQVVGFYAKSDRLSDELQQVFDEMNKDLVKNDIQRKAITVFHDSIIEKYLKDDFLKKHNTVAKALSPEKYGSDVSIECYADFVQILSQKNLQAVLIQDADIAKALRQIFEMVWELVEKDKENYLKFSSLNKIKKEEIKKPEEDINIKINRIAEI